ncbi:alpha/beta hydrolase [Streptomyces tauricus]
MSLSLDPEFAQVFAPMAEAMAGTTPPAVGDVAARRALWEPIIGAASAAQPVPADVTTTEYHATADDGTKITLRWYAKTDAPAGPAGPAALFFHGGGYIFGHIDLFDGPVARYVSAGGVPMLSVEYRRAPEHPFPTPVEDAYTALRWLHEHAGDLGVDPSRIGVMGDSAGGGLAAALTILARERGGPSIARQILLMPMLDDRTAAPDPHIEPYLLWSYDDSRTAWPALLGDAAGGPDVPATAAPARLEDATGLPPAYIEVGQLDVFRDEDLAYALKLSRAGVPVEFHLHPGVPHEFDSIAFTTDVARRAVADRVRALASL